MLSVSVHCTNYYDPDTMKSHAGCSDHIQCACVCVCLSVHMWADVGCRCMGPLVCLALILRILIHFWEVQPFLFPHKQDFIQGGGESHPFGPPFTIGNFFLIN